jgi:acetyl esterase
MPVKPEVQVALDFIETNAVPLAEQTPEDLRTAYQALSTLRPEIEQVEAVVDRGIPGPAGDVPVRVYQPAGRLEAVAPVLVWLHGGGWVIGNLETADSTARALSNAAGVVVVSVDYRLAPEHKFPAAVDDCLAVVRWVAEHAAELGADPGRLAVGGDSAGGNLAAVVCQELRDSGPAIRFQLLVYPVTDARMGHPSYVENAEGYFLTQEAMAWFVDHYTAGDDECHDPRVSPLLASDEAVTGLPPGLVITAEYDPLRDEGEAYGKRLQESGCDVAVRRYDGVIHGFFSMGDFIPDGSVAVQHASESLRRALAREDEARPGS